MRTRQRLVRALITEIVVDIDKAAGEIVLVIHWKGGQHSELRVRKPRTGNTDVGTPEQALAVMRSMAGRWSDQDIAASLNRMGMPTGQGKTWTAQRVGDLRRVRGIHGYRSAEKNGEWLTLRDAAASSVSATIKFASSSRLASSIASRLCPTHHTRSVRPTSQVSRSLLHSSKKVARVGSIPKDRSQCLQVLEEEV